MALDEQSPYARVSHTGMSKKMSVITKGKTAKTMAKSSAKVTAPLARSTVATRTLGPRMVSNKDRSVSVENREMVAEVLGATSLISSTISTMLIQPGLPWAFPWLSSMASLFESYKVEYLELEYVPFVGASTNGVFFAAVGEDPSETGPRDIQAMGNYRYTLRTPIWEGAKLRIPGSYFHTLSSWKYIRTSVAADAGLSNTLGPIITRGAQPSFDAGYIAYGVHGAAAATYCGFLYLNYRFQLRSPIMSRIQVTSLSSAYFYSDATGATSTNWLPNVQIYGGGPLAAAPDTNAYGVGFFFNSPGRYAIYVRLYSPAPNPVNTITVGTLGTGSSRVENPAAPDFFSNGQRSFGAWFFQLANPQEVVRIQLPASMVPTGTGTTDRTVVWVCSLPSN